MRHHYRTAFTLILVGTILLTTLTAAFTTGGPQVTWQNPVTGDNISGNVTFNVSTNTTLSPENVRNVTFTHNETPGGGFNYTVAVVRNNTSDQRFFSTTNDTNTLFDTDGQKWVNATAINASGLANWSLRSFTVDNTPPLLTPRLPVQAANLSGTFFVNATWSDATSGVENASFNLTNTIGTLLRDAPLNNTVNSTTLLDGTYNLSYNAVDFAANNNSSVDARTVTVDNTAPNITPRLPVDGANVSGTFAVEATWSDAMSGVENATFNVTQLAAPRWGPVPLNNTVDSTALSDGTYNISYNATDFAGNWNASLDARTITVDNAPPHLTIDSPLNTSIADASPFLNVTGNEAVDTWLYALDTNTSNSTFDTATARLANTTLPILADGPHNVTVYANDTAGNGNSSFRAFTVDTTPPAFWNNQTNSTAAGEAIEHRVYVNDSVGLNKYVFSFDNGTGSFTNDTVLRVLQGSFPSANWTNETKRVNQTVGSTIRWRVYANDTAGNLASSGTFAYTTTDEKPPLARNATQNVSHVQAGETVALSAFGRDETNLSHAWLATNESGMFQNKTGNYSSPQQLYTSGVWTRATFSWDNDSFTSGAVGWRVWFNDTAGNWNVTAIKTFTVDGTPPTITPMLPVQAANISGTFFVNATWSDATTNVTVTGYNLTNITAGGAYAVWRNGSLNDTIDSTALQDGTYNLSYNATDFVGNVNASVYARTVAVDNTAPTITPRLPVDGSNVSGNISINATWSDATSGVDTANYTVSNASGVQAVGGLNATFDTATLGDGTYNVSYNATDFAGNTNTSSNASTITVDNTPPQFATNTTNHSIVSPYAWTNRTNATLTTTLTDVRGINNTTVGVHALNLSIEKAGNMLPLNLSVAGANGAVNLSLSGLATNLSHGVLYNVTAVASDLLGNRNTSLNWSFRTDFNPPANVTINDTFGSPVYNGWFLDERTVQFDACFEPADESGADAAAVLLNGVYRAWNTSIRTGPFNVTLNASGNRTYTFACRDIAGNANTSFNRSYAIDALGPSLLSSNPADDSTGVSTSFTFAGTLHNESNESGLNVSASSIRLVKDSSQSGTLSNVNWTNGSVTADVSGLNNDDPYDIEGFAVDNVGHNVSFKVDIRTKAASTSNGGGGGGGGGGGDDGGSSGGGGGTFGTDSLTFASAPSGVPVTAGRSTTFEVTVEDDGETSLSGIELGLDGPSGLSVSSTPADFDLDAGDQQTVDVELTAASDVAANIYQVTLNATADDGTEATHTMDVTVEEPRPNLTLVNPPAAVDVPAGENVSARFVVENTGTGAAMRVAPAFVSAAVNAYVGGRFQVRAGRSRTVTVNMTAGPGSMVGVYNGTFTLTHPSKNLSHPVAVRVQPGTDAEREEIRRDIGRLRDQFNSVRGQLSEEEASTLQQLLQQATTAAGEGDYATVAERRNAIQRTLQDVEPQQNIILPAFVVAAIIILLAVLFYFFPPREIWQEIVRRMRKEEGYRPRTRGRQRRETLREKMEQSRTDLLRESFETAAESEREQQRKEEEERGYQYRG